MTQYRKRTVAFAVSLAALAGFVDAVGFMSLGGFFVSFMSGNSTRVGVGAGEQNATQAGLALGLITLFVLGVASGTMVGHKFKDRRRFAVLFTVTLLLAIGSALYQASLPAAGAALQVLAMGAINAVFERNGEVSVGVTYVTGALVRMGHGLALMMQGGPKWNWVPYACLWLGLVFGACSGAVAFAAGGAKVLWIATAYCGLMAPLSERVP